MSRGALGRLKGQRPPSYTRRSRRSLATSCLAREVMLFGRHSQRLLRMLLPGTGSDAFRQTPPEATAHVAAWHGKRCFSADTPRSYCAACCLARELMLFGRHSQRLLVMLLPGTGSDAFRQTLPEATAHVAAWHGK
jgi:hypothetical protein